MIRKCLTCKKEFKVSIYYVRKGGGKFCSKKCYGVSKLGKSPWNKGTIGMIKPNSGSFKNGHQSWNKGMEWEEKQGENNCNWKGDDVGKVALHLWVTRYKGKPKICEHCKATCKERKLNWANKDHTYKRVLDDFISLCVSCHRKYDIKYNGYKVGFNK